MSKYHSIAASMLLMAATAGAADSYTSMVNPFIGTTNFGTTNPGAVVPNGMMSPAGGRLLTSITTSSLPAMPTAR